MNLSHLKKLYQKSPAFVKNIYAQIPWHLRAGRHYRKTLGFLQASEFWSNEQWFKYQTTQLKLLLEFCNENVPYYQQLFKINNIRPEANDIWAEYRKIPYLTKAIVREQASQLQPGNYSKQSVYSASTGGTTGKPVSIFHDAESYQAEWAYKHFFWNRAISYLPSDRKATFRGVEQSGGLYHDNPIYNEIRFSPFRLEQDDDLELICQKLTEYKPKYLHGYPSALLQLAKYIDNTGIDLSPITGVILISENIFPYQVNKLKEIFDCSVYSFYGLSERVAFASMSRDCDCYYAHPGYGIFELNDENGSLIDAADVRGEITATGFINRAMPLIKYQTNDFASYADINHSSWNMPALNAIQGRWNQEFLKGKDNERISLTALNLHDDIFDNVKKLQISQNKAGIVRLNIVRADEFNLDDEARIKMAYEKKLGNGFKLVLNYMENIELTGSGKEKYFLSTLDT